MQLFEGIESELIKRIGESTQKIKIAVTWFTNHNLLNSIIIKLNEDFYEAELIVLNDRINNKPEGVDFQKFIDCKGNFYYSDVDRMVHHKFCIIDDKIVITGSYNWTYYAENRNWENIIVIENEASVKAYIQEFEKIKASHEKVKQVSEKRKLSVMLETTEYLQTDYFLQAKNQQQRGNDISAAKVYTEIVKLNSTQAEEAQKERSEIISRLNNERLEVCPFEIGIVYHNGYQAAIPSFSLLPIAVTKGGRNVNANTTALTVTIQKRDYTNTVNLLAFTIKGLKACPANTEKLEIKLYIGHDGIMAVDCRELNGYNRIKETQYVDLKNYL